MDPSVLSALSGAPPLLVLAAFAWATWRILERQSERHATALREQEAAFLAHVERAGQRLDANTAALVGVEKALIQLGTVVAGEVRARKLPVRSGS